MSTVPPDVPPGEEETVVQRGAPPPPPPPGPVGPPPEEVERQLWPWLLVLLLLIVGGVVAWLLLRGDGGQRRPVPQVLGLSQDSAVARLRQDGFRTRIENRFSNKQEGVVIDEDPAAGRKVERGSVVTVVVSRGQRAVTVPNLISLPQSDAVAQLTKAGLNPDVTLVPSPQPEGRVVAQSPAAGIEVDPGTSVRVNVSKGRTTTTVETTTTTVQTTTQTTPTVTTTGTVTTTVPTSP